MKIEDIRNVLVIGAGAMGHGIAQLFAASGYCVHLMDVDQRKLEHALAMIEASLATLEKSGLSCLAERKGILDRVHTFTNLAAAAEGVQLVVEAVPEVADLKRSILAQLDEICAPNTILATNTSGLDVFELAVGGRQSHLVATHFFAPAQIVPLVEVAPGPGTLPEVVEITAALMRRIGKEPVVMRQFVRSFIVNRIQSAITKPIFEMLENGWATPEEIDRAVKLSLGVRLPVVGVVQTYDFTGLDSVNAITSSRGVRIPVIEQCVERGHLGAKTSKGLYDYQGRSEAEIAEKRDLRYLEVLKLLKKIDAFDPI